MKKQETITEMVRRIIKEEEWQRFNLEVLEDKPAIDKRFETNKYKIVRSAYDDEGNNAYIIFDKINKKIISYSISGASQFKRWDDLVKKST